MCVQCGCSRHFVFFRGKRIFQLPVFICPGRVSFIERLRNTAPAHILRKHLLIFRRCRPVFLLQCFQRADRAHVVFKLGLLTAFTQVVIRNPIIDRRLRSSLLHRRKFHLRAFFRLCLLQRFCPEGQIPLITVQQRPQNALAFRTEDRINHFRVAEGDIIEADTIYRERASIQIDRIARMQIIRKGRLLWRSLRMLGRRQRLIQCQVNGDFPHSGNSIMLRYTAFTGP